MCKISFILIPLCAREKLATELKCRKTATVIMAIAKYLYTNRVTMQNKFWRRNEINAINLLPIPGPKILLSKKRVIRFSCLRCNYNFRGYPLSLTKGKEKSIIYYTSAWMVEQEFNDLNVMIKTTSFAILRYISMILRQRHCPLKIWCLTFGCHKDLISQNIIGTIIVWNTHKTSVSGFQFLKVAGSIYYYADCTNQI